MASMWRSVRTPVVAAVLMAALASSCSPRQDEKAVAPESGGSDSAPVAQSALGGFLAGWLAHADGDNRAAARYFASALDHDPDNRDLMQRTFTLMVEDGDMDGALPLAKRLIELDTQSPLPLLVLGVQDAKDGHYAQAASRFSSLHKQGINAFLGPLLSAWSLAGQGQTDAAVSTLKPLADNNMLKRLGAFHAGLINDLADRTDAAQREYTLAMAGESSLRTIEAVGSFYQRTGHVDRAKEIYDRYRAEHPDTLLFDGSEMLKAGVRVPRMVTDARSGLAEALFDSATMMRQANADDLAMVFCRLSLALQPDFPLAQMTIGDILSSVGRAQQADAMYGAIDKGSPVHAFGQLRVAMNLDEAGDRKGAINILESLAKERPDNVDTLITLADIQRKHKQYLEAAQAYSEAIVRMPADQPQLWALYYSRGIVYERSNQWPKAEADFQKALKLQPDQPDVLNYLGYSWVDRGEKLDNARAMIEKAVSLRPNDGAIVDSLGWALYRMGDYAESVTQLEHAVELKPVDPTINEHLGDAYWRVGRRNEARFQWRRALEMNPDADQIAGLKEKVQTGELPPATTAKQ